jgi:hypothetical protein
LTVPSSWSAMRTLIEELFRAELTHPPMALLPH